MTTDREAFLASFKEYLATTPAVELLNDYTYLLIYINHDPYDEQERYQYLVDAVSTVGTKFSQVDTWRAGCAKRQREDDNAFWESAMAWHDHHYAKAPEPYCLSDVPCEETEWLVPDVLPRGEIFDGSTDKKDADFMEERRLRLAQTKDDTTAAILNALAESRLGSMASSELRAAVTKEVGCSEKTYNRAYAELVKSGRITKKAIRERDGCNRWYSFSDWSKSDDQLKK